MEVKLEVKEEHPASDLGPHTAAAPLQRVEGSPFPGWAAPLPGECDAVTSRLAAVHGWPSKAQEHRQPHQLSVLDSLVRTMLSQNTTDVTSLRAFQTLKLRFHSWDEVRLAPTAEVEEAIRVGGLAEVKVQRIKALLETLLEERGECSLEHLRALPTESVKEELSRFKGVGPKTVACVLLFALGRPDFAVDTHVWEIAKALSWAPLNCSREQAYAHLNRRVPDHLKHDLHVLLVQHGKQCAACAKAGSAKRAAAAAGGAACPLAEFKPPTSQLKKAAAVRDGSAAKRGSSGSSKAAAGGSSGGGGLQKMDAAAEAAAAGAAAKRRRAR